MTSASSLALACIKVVAPLIDMIVDNEEDHIGQLKYPGNVKKNKDAKEFLEKLSKDSNRACITFKSNLDSLDSDSQKVDRNTEEGILIHMTIQAIRLLSDEMARLENLTATDDVDRYFPSDMKDKRVVALQKLIKKHNGDADAESVVSLSESAYPTQKIVESVAESSESESSESSEPSTVVESVASASSEPAVADASSEPAVADVSSEPAVADASSEPAVASVASVVAFEKKKIDPDESESLIEAASEILEEPVETVVPEKVTFDYSGMSREDLLAAKKKYKTHKQKDAFIEGLIDALTGTVSKPAKMPVADVVAEVVVAPAGKFIVEDVSKFKRSKNGVEQVLVKWKDYPLEQMTWETKTDELSRSKVSGSFFQSSDTSYKKFCERVGLTTAEACSKIEEKDKTDCAKRNSKKSADEEQEDCSASVTFSDADEEDSPVEEDADADDDKSEDASSATASSVAATSTAAATASSEIASAEAVEEEVEDAMAEDETSAVIDAIEETL